MAHSLHCYPNHIEYDHMVLMSISGEERHIHRIDVPGWVAAGATVVLDNTPLPIVPDCLWAWNDGLGELEGGGTPEEPVAPSTGAINTLSNGSLQGGSGYVDAVYSDVALTGGTGSGARADINVSGGAVTVVSLDQAGDGYTAGDELSADAANIGGTGSGFSIAVGSILTARGNVIYAGYSSRL